MKYITDKIIWTKAMKDYANEVAEKRLHRFIEDPTKDMTIRLSKLNDEDVKVSVHIGEFKAQEVNTDFYAALSNAMNKMKQLITKYREKYSSKRQHQRKRSMEENIEKELPMDELISKEKVFSLQAITVEEAISNIEHTDYSFYVYKDTSAGSVVSVLYKRLNGTYGVIRCH